MAALHRRYPDDVEATAFYALQMASAGHRDEAVAELRKAVAPFIEKPTLELLGDQLLAMKRRAEAAEAYRAALARTPGRTVAAEGLAQAISSGSDYSGRANGQTDDPGHGGKSEPQ